MRAGLMALLICALAGCDREPSFDERYQAEAERLGREATNMQDELSAQLNASIAAGKLGVDPDMPLASNAVAP